MGCSSLASCETRGRWRGHAPRGLEKVARLAALSCSGCRRRWRRSGVSYLAGELPQGKLGVGYALLRDLRGGAGGGGAHAWSWREVDRTFSAIKAEAGAGSAGRRAALLRGLMERATADEQELLARLVLGELRQGALEGIVIEAVARAFGAPRRAGAQGGHAGGGGGAGGGGPGRGGAGRADPLRAAPVSPGAADAGRHGRRRGGRPRAAGRGRLRVQGRRRARADPQGRRPGRGLQPRAQPGHRRRSRRSSSGCARCRPAGWSSTARPSPCPPDAPPAALPDHHAPLRPPPGRRPPAPGAARSRCSSSTSCASTTTP